MLLNVLYQKKSLREVEFLFQQSHSANTSLLLQKSFPSLVTIKYLWTESVTWNRNSRFELKAIRLIWIRNLLSTLMKIKISWAYFKKKSFIKSSLKWLLRSNSCDYNVDELIVNLICSADCKVG